MFAVNLDVINWCGVKVCGRLHAVKIHCISVCDSARAICGWAAKDNDKKGNRHKDGQRESSCISAWSLFVGGTANGPFELRFESDPMGNEYAQSIWCGTYLLQGKQDW